MLKHTVKLLTFSGRRGRLYYLMIFSFSLLLFILSAECILVALSSMGIKESTEDLPLLLKQIKVSYYFAIALISVSFLTVFFIFVAYSSSEVRRLHDCGLSGWFLLLHVLILFLPPSVPVAGSAVFHWGWIALLVVVPGPKGPNRYGGQPKWFE